MQAPLEVTLPEKGKDPVELQKMIADWEQAIELWFTTHLPDGLEGTLWFDLTIMSNLTAQPMPLLRLRKRYLPIGDLEPPLPTEPVLEGVVR